MEVPIKVKTQVRIPETTEVQIKAEAQAKMVRAVQVLQKQSNQNQLLN